MIERTIFFIPVIINLNIKKNFDITKPRHSWRAQFGGGGGGGGGGPPPPRTPCTLPLDLPLGCRAIL